LNPITPQNIHRHELIGLTVEVIESSDKQLLGLKGCVIDETQKTLTIETQTTNKPNEKERNRVIVFKKNNTFRFSLPSGEQVDVSGVTISLRSENRLKNILRKRW
jgi:ribonuclease P protein subunit POP4